MIWTQRVVRGLLRYVYPDHESQQEQLSDITQLLKRTDERLREQTSELKELRALQDAVRRLPTRETVRAIEEQTAKTDLRLRRHARDIAARLRRGDARGEKSQSERRVSARLERIAAGAGPILVGPWSGEVGFELLYWIPFVHWFQQRYEVDRNRLVVLSRGGVAPWYAHVTTRYVDALSHVTPDEFRAATEAAKKQRGITRFDVALLRTVRRSGKVAGRCRLLHPQLMYQLFWQFWKENESAKLVDRYTAFELLKSRAAGSLPPGLPAQYVAARFYFSDCFPDTPTNRAFVSRTLQAIAKTIDVVLINTPFRIDDHQDFSEALGSRVHTIPTMPPPSNLAIQTEVIRGARAFVGTYGGYAYLAPLLGVPSLSFFSTRTFYQHHLDLAQRVVDRLGAPSLAVLDVKDAEVLGGMLGAGALAPQAAHP